MNQGQNRDARYALAILFAVNMMNFFDRQIIAAVSKPIIDEWNRLAEGFLRCAASLVGADVRFVRRRIDDQKRCGEVAGANERTGDQVNRWPHRQGHQRRYLEEHPLQSAPKEAGAPWLLITPRFTPAMSSKPHHFFLAA
jgi:hypothetical protein